MLLGFEKTLSKKQNGTKLYAFFRISHQICCALVLSKSTKIDIVEYELLLFFHNNIHLIGDL